MPQFLYANNASTTLAGPIAANATVVNLAAGTGALFPNPGVGQQFALTFVSAGNPSVIEIAYCTGRNGDACTIARGQEGTPATAFIAGDLASNDLTAGTCAAFVQAAQQQIDAPNYGVDVGPVNAIQVTLNPQPGSLALITGAAIRVLVGHTNTGPTTLTITGLPTTTVFAQSGAAPLPAGMLIVGQTYEFIYVSGVGFQVSTARVLLSTPNLWAQSQIMANADWWSGNNTSGQGQPLLGVNNQNFTTMFAGPSGATAWQVLNSAATAALMYLGSAGGLHAIGDITADTGNISSSVGNVTAPAGTVSGGSLTTTLGAIISAAATMSLIPGASGLFINNHANTLTNVFIDDAGNTTVERGALGVAGAITGNSSITAVGAVNGLSVNSFNGNIVANGALLRASFGTTGSNDANAAPILADFAAAGSGTGWWITLPSLGLISNTADSLIIQGGQVTVPANNTPTVFNLVRPFPTNFLGIVISYGAVTPPSSPLFGSVGAQPANNAQFYATNTSASGVPNGCFYIAVGY